MSPPAKYRIALYSHTGHHLRMSLVRGAVAVLAKHPDVELLLQDGMPYSEWRFIHRMQPEGVLCTLLNDTDCEKAMECKGVVINVAELLDVKSLPAVHVDNVECGVIAARHLHSTGLNHFGYVGVERGTNSEKRLAGFVSQLGKEMDCKVFRFPPYPKDLNHWSHATRKLATWIEPLPKPIGLYVFSDVHARAVIEATRSLNLRVPHDVAVVGTGNYDMDTLISRPPLTSVPLNWRKVAYVATEHLITGMKGGVIPPVTLVRPRPLFIRGSSNHFFSSDQAVAKALQYIHDHYLEEIHVDEVARAAGLSRRVLEKRFRAATASSVYAFIHAIRLRKAKILLMDTEETVESVARMSGFREGRLLITAMKKASGITPGEYRKQVSLP